MPRSDDDDGAGEGGRDESPGAHAGPTDAVAEPAGTASRRSTLPPAAELAVEIAVPVPEVASPARNEPGTAGEAPHRPDNRQEIHVAPGAELAGGKPVPEPEVASSSRNEPGTAAAMVVPRGEPGTWEAACCAVFPVAVGGYDSGPSQARRFSGPAGP